MQRRALGKGLKALIPVTDEKVGSAFEIAVEDVRPNRYQPRKIFDDLKLTELVNSIREKGVVQPIIVQKSDSGYELIAGERRWRAAQKAGLNKIPAIIREVSSEESLELALIENGFDLRRGKCDVLPERGYGTVVALFFKFRLNCFRISATI